MIGLRKLQLFTQLHLSEQSWLGTAEHCSLFLSSKVDTQDSQEILLSLLRLKFFLVFLDVVFKGHRVCKHHHITY